MSRLLAIPWVPVGLLTLLAAALSFTGLEAQSLSHDELSTWARTEFRGLKGLLQYGVRTDLHPPGHFLLIWCIKQAGFDSAFAMRLPSAVASVLSVPLLCRIGTRLFDRSTGLLAAALMAVSWCMVYYAQDARAYSLVVLTSLVTIDAAIGLIRHLRKGRWPSYWLWLQLIVYGSLSAYLHYYGLFFVGLLGMGCLLCLVPRPRQSLAMLAGFSVIGLGYLPWLDPLLEDLSRDSSWMPRQGIAFFPRWFSWIFGNATAPGVAAALALLSGIIHASVRWKRTRSLNGWAIPTLVALWLLTPGLVAFAKSMVSTPALTNKNLLMCAPAAYLLVALSLTRLPLKGIIRHGLGVGLVGLLLVELVGIKDYYRATEKRQYREAVASVVDRGGDPLIVVCGIRPHFEYYLDRAGAASPELNLCKAKQIPAFQAAMKENPHRLVAVVWAHYGPDKEVLAFLANQPVVAESSDLIGAKVMWLQKEEAPPPSPDEPPTAASTAEAPACEPHYSDQSDWSVWSRRGAPHSFSVRDGVAEVVASEGIERKTDVCLKQRVPLKRDLKVSGSWSVDLRRGSTAQLSARFFGANGKWVKGAGDERPYKLIATTTQGQEWLQIDRHVRRPKDAVSAQICIELVARTGAIRVRDLCLTDAMSK